MLFCFAKTAFGREPKSLRKGEAARVKRSFRNPGFGIEFC